MTDRYDAIAIGSGLGGLTAAALYANAGYRVLVLEQNAAFGGAATTYPRGDLTVEVSLHETTDPRTTLDPKGEVFEALDLYDEIEFVPVATFYEVRGRLIGAPLTLPHGTAALCESLAQRFPRDAQALKRFFRQLDAIHAAVALFGEKHDGRWWLLHAAEIPLRLWPVLKDIRATLAEVLTRYFGDNEALKIALAANLAYYDDDADRLWWLAYAVAQGGYFRGGGSYLKGGSQTLSDRLVDRVREAGGDVWAECRVETVLLDDDGAIEGVQYRILPEAEDGGAEAPLHTVFAPVVFANPAPQALAVMLPAQKRATFLAPYRDEPLSVSLFSITLSLRRPPASLGVSAYSTILIPDWMGSLQGFRYCAALLGAMPGERLPVLTIVDYARIDSGLRQPGGNYPVSVVGVDRLDNWQGLDSHTYHARKEAWLQAILQRLDREWPGFAAAVAHAEMATARTMHAYLGTPGGAVYGFAPRVPDNPLAGPPRSPETEIRGLFLASSFGGFGGFSGAMGAGAAAVKAAMKR